MPQTSPLNWIILSLMPFIISSFLFNFQKPKKSIMMKKNIKISQNIWKW